MGMVPVDAIPKRYDEAVELLARWHGEDQDPSVTIYAFPDPDQAVVRLVEVSEAFPAGDKVEGKPTTYALGRSKDFPYRSEVVMVTPSEWDQIASGKLKLPEGWRFSECRKVWPDGS